MWPAPAPASRTHEARPGRHCTLTVQAVSRSRRFMRPAARPRAGAGHGTPGLVLARVLAR
eukprot:267076-Hanusia_phi.AAC.1